MIHHSNLRDKVRQDARGEALDTDNLSLGYIHATDGSSNSVGVVDLDTMESMGHLHKLVFSGVDYIPTPQQHWALLLHGSRQRQQSYAIPLDRKWVQPYVFARPPFYLAR